MRLKQENIVYYQNFKRLPEEREKAMLENIQLRITSQTSLSVKLSQRVGEEIKASLDDL